ARRDRQSASRTRRPRGDREVSMPATPARPALRPREAPARALVPPRAGGAARPGARASRREAAREGRDAGRGTQQRVKWWAEIGSVGADLKKNLPPKHKQ